MHRPLRNGEPVGELEGFSATLIAEEAIEWLKGRPDVEHPFFLTVWTHEPHRPIESDPRFMAMYPDVKDKRKDYARVYNSRDDVKARRREYSRKRNQRPDVKEWRRNYMRDYRRKKKEEKK